MRDARRQIKLRHGPTGRFEGGVGGALHQASSAEVPGDHVQVSARLQAIGEALVQFPRAIGVHRLDDRLANAVVPGLDAIVMHAQGFIGQCAAA